MAQTQSATIPDMIKLMKPAGRTPTCFRKLSVAILSVFECVTWTIYIIISTIFQVVYIVNHVDNTGDPIYHISLTIATILCILVLFLSFLALKCVYKTSLKSILAAIITVLCTCHVVCKLLLYDFGLRTKEFNFACVLEVVFVCIWAHHSRTTRPWVSALYFSLLTYGVVETFMDERRSSLIIAHSITLAGLLLIFIIYSYFASKPRHNQGLAKQRVVWETLLGGLPDLVLLIDTSREIIYRNSSYSQFAVSQNLNGDEITILSCMNKLRLKENNPELRDWLKGIEEDHCRSKLHLSEVNSDSYVHVRNTSPSSPIAARRSTHQWKDLSLMNSRIHRPSAQIEPDSPFGITSAKLQRKKPQNKSHMDLSLTQLITAITHDIDAYYKLVNGEVHILYGKMRNLDTTEGSFEIKLSVISVESKLTLLIVLSETTHRDKVLRLEETTHYKNKLLGSISHELRTPLNCNLNFLSIACEDSDVPSSYKQKYIEPALKCARLLTYLVNDILDYSQLSTNSLTLNFSKQNLRQVIEDVVELLSSQAAQKDLKMTLDVESTVPEEIRTDFTRMSQILVNLLKNALAHTFAGEIRIKVAAAPNCQDIYRIEVEDTGIGINNEERLKLEDILMAAVTKDGHEKITNESMVNNLGLKISTRLSGLLCPTKKGGLRFQSMFDSGSMFYFYVEHRQETLDHFDVEITSFKDFKLNFAGRTQLQSINTKSLRLNETGPPELFGGEEDAVPGEIKNFFASHKSKISLRESAITSPNHLTSPPKLMLPLNGRQTLQYNLQSAVEDAPTPQSNNKYTCECSDVLIVDDDAFNILSLGMMLNSLGLQYQEAYNGQLAIDKIMSKTLCCEYCRLYSMIFMDCNMPVKDGYDTSFELKQMMIRDELPFIPIVACTAYVVDYQTSKCKEMGMDEYLCKPVDKRTLNGVLKKWNLLR